MTLRLSQFLSRLLSRILTLWCCSYSCIQPQPIMKSNSTNYACWFQVGSVQTQSENPHFHKLQDQTNQATQQNLWLTPQLRSRDHAQLFIWWVVFGLTVVPWHDFWYVCMRSRALWDPKVPWRAVLLHSEETVSSADSANLRGRE